MKTLLPLQLLVAPARSFFTTAAIAPMALVRRWLLGRITANRPN